ncbi:MAG TPA: hypothetical protein PKC24_04715 [Cyclobacteriaceae bacterium]|nr:hypothetical protein [Cyclobacteriaceae bacterium]
MLKNIAGIWMDQSKAHLITFRGTEAVITTIESSYKRLSREEGKGSTNTRFRADAFSNNEDNKQNKKMLEKAKYFKEIEKSIKNLEEVYLFGPTNAKIEFLNLLQEKKTFMGRVSKVENADKMTRNQMVARVKEFFDLKK